MTKVHLFRFSLTDTINEKDPIWRDAGKSFVDSVTKLLERLLDYRDVLKVRYLHSRPS